MGSDMTYSHEPVMLNECVGALTLKSGGVYLDGTAGLGGHSEEIAKRLDGGRLICLDKDPMAVERCSERLAPYGERVTVVRNDFRDLSSVLDRLGVQGADGILLDLGVSSLQLDMPERGFSYRFDAPLDMRMDNDASLNAYDIVNTWEENRIKRILYDYGEERYAPLIASAIVRNRPILSTGRLAETVKRAMPPKARRESQHPARRAFQAIRIAVNDELGALEQGLDAAVGRLNPGGRLAVLTFHSLEDRIVKNRFRRLENSCTCPPDFPECVCGEKRILRIIGRYSPSREETERNPRAECAKLRVAEKV